MKSVVSVVSVPGATDRVMTKHIKGYVEDTSLDAVILHDGTNELKKVDTAKKITTNIV